MSELKIISNITELVDFDVEKEQKWIDGYCSVVWDLLSHEKVKEMKQYHHHKDVTCHFHSVFVSYLTYKTCTMLNYNTDEATRAALLHDFYLYDWHITKHEEWHALYHPKVAKINAEKYFGNLTEMQSDMILSHMWPLHYAPPKSKEGMILTLADKVCANSDLMGLSVKFLPIYNAINSETEKYEYNNNDY
jgi:uncharacterized protein